MEKSAPALVELDGIMALCSPAFFTFSFHHSCRLSYFRGGNLPILPAGRNTGTDGDLKTKCALWRSRRLFFLELSGDFSRWRLDRAAFKF